MKSLLEKNPPQTVGLKLVRIGFYEMFDYSDHWEATLFLIPGRL